MSRNVCKQVQIYTNLVSFIFKIETEILILYIFEMFERKYYFRSSFCVYKQVRLFASIGRYSLLFIISIYFLEFHVKQIIISLFLSCSITHYEVEYNMVVVYIFFSLCQFLYYNEYKEFTIIRQGCKTFSLVVETNF